MVICIEYVGRSLIPQSLSSRQGEPSFFGTCIVPVGRLGQLQPNEVVAQRADKNQRQEPQIPPAIKHLADEQNEGIAPLDMLGHRPPIGGKHQEGDGIEEH